MGLSDSSSHNISCATASQIACKLSPLEILSALSNLASATKQGWPKLQPELLLL